MSNRKDYRNINMSLYNSIEQQQVVNPNELFQSKSKNVAFDRSQTIDINNFNHRKSALNSNRATMNQQQLI